MIGPTFEETLDICQQWYGDEIADLDGRLPEKGEGFLMACLIFGETYANRFVWYCLPTLLAPKNLATLRNRCRIVLFTDKPTRPYLKKLLKGVEETTGIRIIYRTIPDAMMEAITRQPRGEPVENKYWALGIAGQVGIYTAGRAGMAFHQIHPDHVYGPEYFPNLERLSREHEAIAQPGISASITPECHDALYAFKQPDGTLVIPDRDLGDIGWRFLHPQTKASLITDEAFPDNLPLMHLWTWQGQDRLYLSCCHMNAAYMSPALCARAPSRIPATVDAELPAFFPKDKKFYVPKAEDGLTYLELSDGKKAADARRGTMEEFVACCAEKTAYQDDWAPFVEHLYEVPIHPKETFVTEAVVRQQHRSLMACLQDEKPTLKAKAAYALINRWRFRYGG